LKDNSLKEKPFRNGVRDCTNGAAQAGTGAWPACGAMRRERVRRAAFVLPFSFVTFLLGKQEKRNECLITKSVQISNPLPQGPSLLACSKAKDQKLKTSTD
jgi:hypothetical protein